MRSRPLPPLLSPRARAARPRLVPRSLRTTSGLPLLAGVLLLLAVLFTALMPTQRHVLPVTLVPVHLEPGGESLPPGQVVFHLEDGTALLNGSPIAPEGLEPPLRASLAGQPDPVVILDAHDEMPYGDVVRVIEAIHEAGGNTVALAPDISAFLNVEEADTDENLPSTGTATGAPNPIHDVEEAP